MNHVITHPPGVVKLVRCPVCNGANAHPDQPPGQVWDYLWSRPVECWECEGDGYVTESQLRAFARDTESPDLLRLIAERDPFLTPAERLREMGFEEVGA